MRSRMGSVAVLFCLVTFAVAHLVCASPLLMPTSQSQVHEALSDHRTRTVSKEGNVGFDDLEHIVQPITTITEFPDGMKTVHLGSGFVVGRRYFTAYHNLSHRNPGLSTRTTTYLDGIQLIPSYANVEQDIAVFELPIALCTRYCNDVSFGLMPEVIRDRKVYWLRKFKDERVVKQAHVIDVAVLGEMHTTPDADAIGWCRSNLVVEVDTPFLAGSSGAPVLDAATGQIIGIIQGSFESNGVQSGFFKPIDCVLSLVGARALSEL